MEFKVWVDGFPRVLGGVTEDTTCQDMIIALASAMGRTGRFSLLEKWRDNERTLAPTENPLKILYKWGQYATDVQFHLRLSGKSQTITALAQARNKHILKPFPDPPQNEANVKRSLTFSGGHNVTELSTRPRERLKDQLAGNRGAISTSALQNRGPTPSSFQRSVPGVVNESGQRNQQTSSSQPSSPSKKSIKSGHINAGANSGPGKPVPVPRGNVSRSPNRPNNSHLERRSPERVDIREIENDSRLSPNAVRDVDNALDLRDRIPDNNSLSDDHGRVRVEEYDLDKNFPYTGMGKSRPVVPVVTGDDIEFNEEPDPEHVNLLQMVTRQHDRLEQTDLQINRIAADISSLEDSEKSHLERMSFLDGEMSKLQEHSQCYESEIMDLESRRMEDVLEAEKQTEQSLQLEISSIGNKLSNSEQELFLTEAKISLAQQTLAKDNDRLESEQQKIKEKEMNIMQELSTLKQEMVQKLSEQESSDTEYANIYQEIKDLETAIASKKDELDSLENDLKQANMDDFDLSPVEATSPTPTNTGLSENGEAVLKLLESKAPIRVGSTRKMIGSPQKLGEAVSTTKNPHGIWV